MQRAQIASLKVCTPDQTDAAAAAACLIADETVRTDGPEITVPRRSDRLRVRRARRDLRRQRRQQPQRRVRRSRRRRLPRAVRHRAAPDGFFACLCKTKPRMRDRRALQRRYRQRVDRQQRRRQRRRGRRLPRRSLRLRRCRALQRRTELLAGTAFAVRGARRRTRQCELRYHLRLDLCRPRPGRLPEGADGDRAALLPRHPQEVRREQSRSTRSATRRPATICATTFHGAPVAAAAGGIAVCNVSTFSEDVVGTVNIVDGSAAVKVRQRAVTFNPLTQAKPCPVCGGFCLVSRDRCTTDPDCAPGMGPCITAAVCSDGARKDKACRRTPPFGGEITFFGTTSVDCPPNTGLITSNSGGLDINANPRTTGTVSLLPSFPCIGAGFTGNTCLGGTSEGRPCTTAFGVSGWLRAARSASARDRRSRTPALRPASAAPTGPHASTTPTVRAGSVTRPTAVSIRSTSTRTRRVSAPPVRPRVSARSRSTGRASTADHCAPRHLSVLSNGGDLQFRNRACFVNSGIIRIGTPGAIPGTRERRDLLRAGERYGHQHVGRLPGPGALIQRET